MNSSCSEGIQDLEYLYASNTNVSNFVSVKLSGNNNYHVWRSQMLCLLESNNMGGIVDATFASPTYSGIKTMRRYDSLARGWILGSVGDEDVLADVHNLGSAKDIWERLKSIYDPPICLQEETNTVGEGEATDSITRTVDEEDIVPAETHTKSEDKQRIESKKRYLLEVITSKGDWKTAESTVKYHPELLSITEPLEGVCDGSPYLHTAVGIGRNDILKKMLSYMDNEELLEQRASDGSTALHIAAIVGNTDAADLLVKRNKMLLLVKDKDNKDPLQKAYEYMHLDTIGYLLKAVNHIGQPELQSSSVHPADDIAVDLLVNAISAKQYSLASDLVQNFPGSASGSDDVLMALAKNFPSGLDYWETLVYPSFNNILEVLFETMGIALYPALALFCCLLDGPPNIKDIITHLFKLLILTVPVMLASAFGFICFLISIVFFLYFLLYYLLWKGANILAFAPITGIENKRKDFDEANILLTLVCEEIQRLGNSGSNYYTQPILEAACQNAYQVVSEILSRSPEALQSTDKNGYDIIQLAIINRSEKVYNLIYDIGERKNVYRICKDSSENNILHLAGKLAPSSVLNRRTGAALQLQQELQWLQEVEKFVFPSYITQVNIYNETPYMVFTREHKDLVKEGEQWMKTTAESCSITAALIVTIVFAAAITVPGGSNQEKGTPLFKNKVAFIIFATADAISLFASSTALLVFLSILTTRFADKDFLVSLPTRLFIGLLSLLLSTTTMMAAFSATFFLVFCDNKPWMLAPICGLAFIPISFFVTLQFPLLVDLFRSTYSPIFGKQRQSFVKRLTFTILKTLCWIL